MVLSDKHKAFLWALKEVGPLTMRGINKLYTEVVGNKNAERFMQKALNEGYMVPHVNGLQMWGTSRKGANISAPKSEGVALPRTNSLWALETYDGADLRPYTGRAGALDAYAIPSLLYPKGKQLKESV